MASEIVVTRINTEKSIITDKGPQGYQGTQGPQGAQGAQGPQGVQGTQGNQGFQGSSPNYYIGAQASPPSPLSTGLTWYQTDTGKLLIYYGATTGWQPPWQDPWGIVVATAGGTSGKGFATTTSSSSGAGAAGVQDWSGLTVTFNALNGRIYRTTVSGMLGGTNASGSDIGELIIRNAAGTRLAGSRGIVNAIGSIGTFEGRSLQYVESNISGSQRRRAGVFNVSAASAATVYGFADANHQASIVVEDIGASSSTPPAS